MIPAWVPVREDRMSPQPHNTLGKMPEVQSTFWRVWESPRQNFTISSGKWGLQQKAHWNAENKSSSIFLPPWAHRLRFIPRQGTENSSCPWNCTSTNVREPVWLASHGQPTPPPPLLSCKMLSAKELIQVLCTFSILRCLCVSFVSVFLRIVH